MEEDPAQEQDSLVPQQPEQQFQRSIALDKPKRERKKPEKYGFDQDEVNYALNLEAAHDREKEMLHEITELQWRLICAQDELQKYKTENAQV
ncbi:hypothetical protein LWI29_006100 [Acer saccharum]|uniref:Uncharacterized protein n=1 Tax=Acer saccharum TaxID=4024 RepID=A0AA39SLK3_ACESA|nr:hypothetical protein LWI29_006100 [Acer saccharum]